MSRIRVSISRFAQLQIDADLVPRNNYDTAPSAELTQRLRMSPWERRKPSKSVISLQS